MKLIFCLSFVFFCLISKAQDSALFSVKYKLTYVIDTTQPETPDIAYFSLFIGKNTSKFIDFIDESSGAVYTTIVSRQPLYKNLVENKIVREISLGQTIYLIADEITVVDWVINKEQKKILGYNCQSATGSFKGRTYTAWFSSQIPYRNGPWKLGGLPGLILEMYDSKKEIKWEGQLIDSKIAIDMKAIQLNKNGISVTKEEFKKLNEAMLKDPSAMRGAVSQTNNSGWIVTVTRNDKKMRLFNNPIEKTK